MRHQTSNICWNLKFVCIRQLVQLFKMFKPARLCAADHFTCVCFIRPDWHGGGIMRVILAAGFLFLCRWRVGGFNTGEIKPALARKSASFLAPLCHLSPPPPPAATLRLPAFDAPIVRRCTSSCRRLHHNKTYRLHQRMWKPSSCWKSPHALLELF